jgi:hypothetical protein
VPLPAEHGSAVRESERRYQVNIAGGSPAALLTSDHVRVDGISLPTKRRAYSGALTGGPSWTC